MSEKRRWCAQCRGGLPRSEWPQGWEPAQATVYVSGRICDDGKWRPYRGYICDDHYTILCDDGATLRARDA